MNSRAALMRGLIILGIVDLVLLAGCGSKTAPTANGQPSPPSGSNTIPTITTISPNIAGAGGAPFMLTINGTNFVTGSVVNFGGTAVTANGSSATQLTALIPAAAIASVGTATVTVTNPPPGGGTSNAANFTITGGPNPVPMISSLSPSGAPIGESGFNLWINGSNFLASSVVRWNGSDRPTTVVDAGSAEARIPVSDIAAAGTATVTVFNPAPGGGSSNPLSFTIATGGAFPKSIAVDPTGKYAYVANFGFAEVFAGNVSMYTIDATTGALTPIGPSVVADHGPDSIAVHPSGKFAYAADSGDQGGGEDIGDVTMYRIDATTGALASIGTIQGFGGSGVLFYAPSSIAVDPSGKFAYVPSEGGPAPTAVSMFTIDATTGALTSIGIVAAGGRAISVAVDPTGKFAYVTTKSDPPESAGNVSMFTIDGNTGALTSIGVIAAGTDPTSVVVDSTGKFAYVTNSGSNNVSMYSINTGTLTPIGVTAAGSGPVSMAVDPTGKFAYVANFGSNDVSMYAIDATTGALTPIGPPVAADRGPDSLAVHPSGKFVYVTNFGSNDVSIYSINPVTGALTLIGSIGT